MTPTLTAQPIGHTTPAEWLWVVGVVSLIGAGGVTGFPLDDLWHANYGVDVTMWGPTHLLMIGSAVLSPVAAWLLLGEAGRRAGNPRWRSALWYAAAAGLLIAFSAMQLEFDDGVP